MRLSEDVSDAPPDCSRCPLLPTLPLVFEPLRPTLNPLLFPLPARYPAPMVRKGSAAWTGGLKDGKGTISTESGALQNLQYSYGTRFESGVGTNPEELIGAAHAGCFSMALSAVLGNAGMTADSITTTAAVSLDMIGDAPTVTKIHLDCTARIKGADAAAFEEAAQKAKANCVISRLLAAAEITMDAKLES